MTSRKKRRQRNIRYHDPGVEPIGPPNPFRVSPPLARKVPRSEADRQAIAAAEEKRARKAARRRGEDLEE